MSLGTFVHSSIAVKCLVWDLDQTIWHGRLADGDHPRLRAGVYDVLTTLDNRGVLHSIASTNQHEHAWSHLKRLGIDHFFVFPQISMEHKHESIRHIAHHLGIGFDTLAFIDDDPMEQELVRTMLPDVSVFDADEIPSLPNRAEFSPVMVTRESRNRRRMVQADIIREREMRHLRSLESFLESCDIRFVGRFAETNDAPRICELALRTNRMNVTGKRFDEGEIHRRIARKDALIGSLKDRFGDYGIVAAALLGQRGPVTSVDGMWISCRVGKRGLPAAFFTFLARRTKDRGAQNLVVRYRRTPENRLARFHLGTYGFEAIKEEGLDTFQLDLSRAVRPYPLWMKINES